MSHFFSRHPDQFVTQVCMIKYFIPRFILILLLSTAIGCGKSTQKNVRRVIQPGTKVTLDDRSPFLKIHLRDGRAYVLDKWKTVDKKSISGYGMLLDINRVPVSVGDFVVPADSAVLFETNVLEPSQAVGGLTILTGASVVVTSLCIANPKACFGSCPTFYVTDGHMPQLQAEGFSASIAPSLEATDIDALFRASPAGMDVHVTMKNEALETQVVRFAKLLALPRENGERVYATPHNEWFACGTPIAPSSARTDNEDCRDALHYFDGIERFSLADSTDLAAKEIIELEFDKAPQQEYGLIIASRQTLLTTFLLYQTLAYMGSRAGDWISLLERQPRSTLESAKSIGQELGGIHIYVQDSSLEWKPVVSFNEVGPLATDIRLLRIPTSSAASRKIQIRMNKGLWRLDQVALVPIKKKVEPLEIDPYSVLYDGLENSNAKNVLCDSAQTLVTYPGDTYELIYRLPGMAEHYELFMKSRGYYLEWIRDEWIKEEDPNKAAGMFFDPRGSLKALAPVFKAMEPDMERQFWNSKYVRP